MLTLQTIKADPDFVVKRLAVKGFDGKAVITEILEIDAERRRLQQKCDNDASELKKLAASIGALMKSGDKDKAEEAKARVAAIRGSRRGFRIVLRIARRRCSTCFLPCLTSLVPMCRRG